MQIRVARFKMKSIQLKNLLTTFLFLRPLLGKIIKCNKEFKIIFKSDKARDDKTEKKQFIDFSATLNLIALARRNVVQCEIKYINLILRSKLFLFFFFKSENYLKSKFIRTIKEKSIYCQFVVCLFSSNNFISAEPIGPKFKQSLT